MYRRKRLITNLIFKNLNHNLFQNITSSSIKLLPKVTRYPKLVTNKILKKPGEVETIEESLFNSLKGKVVYNSLVTKRNSAIRWKLRAAKQKEKLDNMKKSSFPITMKLFYDEHELKFDTNCINNEDHSDHGNETEDIQMPYSFVQNVEFKPDFEDNIDGDSESKIHKKKKSFLPEYDVNPPEVKGKKWMSDYYECSFLDDDSEEVQFSNIDYGTADPNIPTSNVPCGGCGAHLHCQNSSIPGYLPSELFLQYSKEDLYSIICQRCTFLKNYNTALSVTVDPNFYPKLIEKIKNKEAFVILIVDMTDFPCSIWPGLFDLIGKDKPIVVVGNKIDLIPGDSPGWLKHAKQVLVDTLPKDLHILHVELISAKTGFGIEELINKLHALWQTRGDVYLLGCTNVGKSSLFNMLLNSDYCKVQAVDLIQRATTSPWPGTTLNLLKFPILRLSAWKSFLRNSRLKRENYERVMENKLKNYEKFYLKNKLSKLPQIIGHINFTFKKSKEERMDEKKIISDFSMPTKVSKKEDPPCKKFIDEDDEYKFDKWCYDTPGVVHPDQIINMLTTTELLKMIPTDMITPRIFSVYPEQTLFIAGLARIDVISCDFKFPRIIVFSSSKLPITLCQTKFADDVYNTLIGTVYMGVPCGSYSRLRNFPVLKYVKDYELIGRDHAIAICDIVLSSVGWISVTGAYQQKSVIRPWTPDGKGIHFRPTPLLRKTANLRKSRVCNTPTYAMKNLNTETHSVVF